MQRQYIPIRVGMVLAATVLLLASALLWYSDVSADASTRGAGRAEAQSESPPNEATSTADHSQFETLQQAFGTGPEVTAACLECHTEAATQVMDTLHWTWDGINEEGEVIGKQNVLNNYCVALDSNEPRCTSCHAGYGWKDDSFDFSVETNVDCLVCHDTTGTYKKLPAGSGHPAYEPTEFPGGSGKIWEPPDLAMIAQNVGQTSRENCGACHFFGGGGDGVKHGDLDSSMTNPDRALDVHMDVDGLNFACTACHTTDGHGVPGSRYEMTAVDTHGIDLPASDGDLATCESCHGTEPMADAKLNDHVDVIACQTCHIPEYARGGKPTKMWWDWSTAGLHNEDGTPIVTKDDNGWVTYDTKKGNFVWAENVTPTYAWYNGRADFTTLATTVDDSGVFALNPIGGGPNDPESRIWPFKLFEGIQPYDSGNMTLAVPHLFGKDEAAYWKSYDWDTAIAAGMEAAGGAYSGEYDFLETEMYWPITHMVAPQEQALNCDDCHSENGRLADVDGIYMPGRDNSPMVDRLGWGISLLAVVGIVVHGGMRAASKRRNGGKIS